MRWFSTMPFLSLSLPVRFPQSVKAILLWRRLRLVKGPYRGIASYLVPVKFLLQIDKVRFLKFFHLLLQY